MVMAEMEGETEEVKSRTCETIVGSSAADGHGGEDRHGLQIGRNGAVLGGALRSGPVGAGWSVEKPIGEARSPEVLSSGQDCMRVPPTQITIFYGGTVSVFDGIPAEKVHEILQIAAAAKATETKNSVSNTPASSPALRRAPSLSSTSIASPGAQSYPIQPTPFCRLATDLPIARRYSLQRFLEKRRDRLVNKNPYSAPTTKKADDATNAPDESCFEDNQAKVVN